MANKNYYEILGINKDASEDDIKKAYRKLSMKWHPDKWAAKSDAEKKDAEQKFKEINEAQQVLLDPEKKKNYDMFGDPDGGGNPFSGFGGFGGFDPFEMFSGRRSGNPFGAQRFEKGQDVRMSVPLTLEDIYMGCTKKVKFQRKTRCPNCHGAGGSGKKACPNCHGTGRIRKTQRMGNSIFTQESECPHCHGTGQIVSNTCPSCNGTGFKESPATIEIKFNPGMPNGAGIKYPEQGHEASSPTNSANGDFIAFAQYAFDTKKYTVENLDIIEKVYIPYYDLLLGCDYTITLPNNKTKKISIPTCVQEGKLIKLYHDGITYNGNTGDYYIEIHYQMPASITADERKSLEAIKVEKTKLKYS